MVKIDNINTALDTVREKLPASPGVYIMRDEHKRILYIGKATSLKIRVGSYFARPHDARIQEMVSRIRYIDVRETRSALEALIIESNLIKKYHPKYNVKEKDGKSYIYVGITKGPWSRPLCIRGKDMDADGVRARFVRGGIFGPYTSGRAIASGLELIRKIFPWSECQSLQKRSPGTACFDYQIGLCPGSCVGAISPEDYARNIKHVVLFLRGRVGTLIKGLEKEMHQAAQSTDFETAARIRNQIFSLKHIRDTAEITDSRSTSMSGTVCDERVECYDISHMSGEGVVGSMVVAIEGDLVPAEYRLFHVQGYEGNHDTAALAEVVSRRLTHTEWEYPTLIVVDGGVGQVNAVRRVLEAQSITIPVMGIAKGPDRKRNDFIIPAGYKNKIGVLHPHHKTLLTRLRDEAHRRAIGFQRKTRSKTFIG